jgi:hypothetical protein
VHGIERGSGKLKTQAADALVAGKKKLPKCQLTTVPRKPFLNGRGASTTQLISG